VPRSVIPTARRGEIFSEVLRLKAEHAGLRVAELKRLLMARHPTLPSRRTLGDWLGGETNPLASANSFDSRPSEELSFFLGAWIGDGWGDENDGGKRMLLKVRSYDFAKEFADCAAKVLAKTDSYWVRRVVDRKGRWYLVKVTSFMLYDFVRQPLSRVEDLIRPFPSPFLRGLCTAEGNPTVSIEMTDGPYLAAGVDVGIMTWSFSNLRKLCSLIWDSIPVESALTCVKGSEPT